MADLLIHGEAPGVARVTSVDPFDSLEMWRIERPQWAHTPEVAGIYLLHGVLADGKLTVYIGMSQKNMRNRIKAHHVTPAKNWFGVLFAIPVPALLCPAIESDLIGRLEEAGVVEVIDNKAQEMRHRSSDDVHVRPAVEKLTGALQLLLGPDIFEPAADDEAPGTIDAVVPRAPRHARFYRGPAEPVRAREDGEPGNADHALVGSSVAAWGQFLGEEPETGFRVLAGSGWRPADAEGKSEAYGANQKRVVDQQVELVEQGVLNADTHLFDQDWDAPNWSVAVRVCSGIYSYSGGWHWQRIAPADDAEPALDGPVAA